MSKIAALIAIPIAYLGVKRLQEEFPNENPQDIKPLISTNNETDEVRKRIEGGAFGL